MVALLASAIGSADRNWGVLRYLYVQPVTRTRLLAGKLGALAVTTVVATGCVLVAGLLAGLVLFGWHPFHLVGAPNLGTGQGIARFLAASGYTVLCMLSIAAIAFALGVALPRGAEALAASVVVVILTSILNGQSHLRAVAVLLPVHYWQNGTHLYDGGNGHLGVGILDQLGTVAIALGVAVLVLLRRDPAA